MKRILLTTFALFALIGCAKELTIANAGAPAELELKAEGKVHAIEITITGDLDGEGEITVIEATGKSEKPFRTVRVGKSPKASAPIAIEPLQIEGDFYDEKEKLQYRPVTATTGRLKVAYRFKKI